MKIIVDENIPLISVRELRENGFDVIDIRGTVEQGISDELAGPTTTIPNRSHVKT